jgi:hypothetical protein
VGSCPNVMIIGVLLAWSVLAAGALLVLIAVGRAGHLEDQTRGYAPPDRPVAGPALLS